MGLHQQDINQLIEADKQYFIHPATNPKLAATTGTNMIFSEGDGIYVTNLVDGKKYIDGMSMLWNVNVGHGREEIIAASSEQMKKIAYSSAFKGFSSEPTIRLAEKLAELAPGDLNSVFFTSGGSESNDTAIKLARFYWGLKGKPEKRNFIALSSAYHGVTLAAQTATGIPAFHEFAGSFIDGVFRATAHLLNAELGDKNDPNYEHSVRGIIEKEGADKIAAVIMEPVQGAGGVNIPPEGYMQAVKKLCEEHDILFIADEVICGFGRTGKMFGVEHWGIVPDMMSIAKGITSGYGQLGGVMVNDKIRETINDYDAVMAHGFTYSGHPTACAIGLENIAVIERENLIENAREMESEMKKGMAYLSEKYPFVTNTRSIGLLAAFELYEYPANGKLFADGVFPGNTVVDACFERQLILRALGAHNQIVAIAPPLVITKEQIAEMITIIDEALTEFASQLN